MPNDGRIDREAQHNTDSEQSTILRAAWQNILYPPLSLPRTLLSSDPRFLHAPLQPRSRLFHASPKLLYTVNCDLFGCSVRIFRSAVG
jgi:hypothetical protein